MIQLAFVTCRKWSEIVDDDRPAADLLQACGYSVVPAVWDDSGVNWSRFAGVVIRSTWDYHLNPDQYAEWLRQRAADGTRLWNPPEAVLANLNKRYLCDLADRGVETAPTRYLSVGSGQQLRELLEDWRWNEAVIKPAVSAGAEGTWRTSLATADADQPRFAEQSRLHDLLIQPYLSEITTGGEWSLVFFRGTYSHAVLKRPGQGDFRVQQHLGGNTVSAEPPPHLIDQAGAVLATIDSPLLYTRVDGVERDGRFVLMELEINEPYLFLGFSAGAADRFAAAIEAVVTA